FSEHKWSDATVRRYQEDGDLRTKRMQAIDPAAWIKSQRSGDYSKIIAIESNFEQVAEYYGERAYNPVVHTELSQSDGSFSRGVLLSRYPHFDWRMRNGTDTNLFRPHASLLDQMCKASTFKGEQVFPMLVALWDAVGIARELNGGLND